MRIACLAVALCLLLSAPAAAQVGGGLTLGETQAQTQTAAPPDTSTTDAGGLKTWQEGLIFGAGIVLIAGIAFAILGDARERARRLQRHPATEGAAEARAADRQRARHEQKRRQRERARRAKASRKRNR